VEPTATVAQAEDDLLAEINAKLATRLAALDAPEYLASECVVARDRVFRESALWLALSALLAAITIAVWT
jgi:hypothetical protein